MSCTQYELATTARVFPLSHLFFSLADLVVPAQAKAHKRLLTAGLKKNKCQSDGLEAASLVITRK